MAPEYDMPEEVAKGYELAKGAPVEFYQRGVGHIDIRNLTPGKAKSLIAAGCKHLVAKEEKNQAGKSQKAAGAES